MYAFAFVISAHCLWRDFFMAKRQSIVWKFFDLVEQDKDGKKIRNAACKICADTTLTYTGGTSNLMHHLEAKQPANTAKQRMKKAMKLINQ